MPASAQHGVGVSWGEPASPARKPLNHWFGLLCFRVTRGACSKFRFPVFTSLSSGWVALELGPGLCIL